MKILCTSFLPRKTSLPSLVLSIGTHVPPSVLMLVFLNDTLDHKILIYILQPSQNQ